VRVEIRKAAWDMLFGWCCSLPLLYERTSRFQTTFIAYARAHRGRARVSQERVEIIGHPSRGLAGGAGLFTQLPAIDTSSLASLSRFRHPQFARLQHVDEKQKGYGV